MDRYIFNPFTFLALVLFGVLALLVLPLVFLGVIGGAFANLGFSWRAAFLILFATLAGSFVNIPLTTFENRVQVYEEEFKRNSSPSSGSYTGSLSPRRGPPLPSMSAVHSYRSSSPCTSSSSPSW